MEQIWPDMVYDFLDTGIALNEFSREEIIEYSKENRKFVCQFLKRNKCVVLINEASEYNYLEGVNIEELY